MHGIVSTQRLLLTAEILDEAGVLGDLYRKHGWRLLETRPGQLAPEFPAASIVQIDGSGLDLKCLIHYVGQVLHKWEKIERSAELPARVTQCALVVVSLSIDIPFDCLLAPTLEWMKYDRHSYGKDKRLPQRDASALASNKEMKQFGQHEEGRGGCCNGADINHAMSHNKTNIHEPVSDDGVSDHGNHNYGEQWPILAKGRGASK